VRFSIHFWRPGNVVITAQETAWETVCGEWVGLDALALAIQEVTCLRCLADTLEPERHARHVLSRERLPRPRRSGKRPP